MWTITHSDTCTKCKDVMAVKNMHPSILSPVEMYLQSLLHRRHHVVFLHGLSKICFDGERASRDSKNGNSAEKV